MTFNTHWCTASNNQIGLIDSNTLLMASANYIASIHISDWSVNWYKKYNSNINDMLVSMPSVYLATDSGLIQVDTSGNLQHQILNVFPVTDCYQSLSGKLYFTGGTKVFRVDTLLNIISSYDLAPVFSKWSSLDGYGDTVIVCGKNKTNDSISIVVFDTSLNFSRQFTLTGQCALPVDIAATENSILVGANDSFTFLYGDTSASLYYRNYNNNGTSVLSGSIMALGNSSIQSVDSFLIETDTLSKGSVLYIYNTISHMSFSVYNAGIDTIKRFAVTSDVTAGVNCGHSYSFSHYTNLELAPGDSMQIKAALEYDAVTKGGYGGTFTIISINGERPAGCDFPTLIIPSITGISTPSIPQIKIFPNPTDGIINIQSTPAPNTTFTLSDINGRVLMEKNLSQTNEQLNIAALAAGMYIYTVRNGNQVPVTGKVIKQ